MTSSGVSIQLTLELLDGGEDLHDELALTVEELVQFDRLT